MVCDYYPTCGWLLLSILTPNQDCVGLPLLTKGVQVDSAGSNHTRHKEGRPIHSTELPAIESFRLGPFWRRGYLPDSLPHHWQKVSPPLDRWHILGGRIGGHIEAWVPTEGGGWWPNKQTDYVLSATGVCAGVIESGWSRLELQRHWSMPVMPEAVMGDKQIMVCVNTNEDSLQHTWYTHKGK